MITNQTKESDKAFIECQFCNYLSPTKIAHINHIIYCEKNPNRKEKKARGRMKVSEKFYNFTIEYLKSHKFISSKNLARNYYNIRGKPKGSQSYGFARVIVALLEENLIEKYNSSNYMRID